MSSAQGCNPCGWVECTAKSAKGAEIFRSLRPLRFSNCTGGKIGTHPAIGVCPKTSTGHSDCPVGHWRRLGAESGNRRIGESARGRKAEGYPLSGLSAIGHWSFGHSVIPIALSGIGGVWTSLKKDYRLTKPCLVLMPFRALEAFGRGVLRDTVLALHPVVLMPCRALEAFGRGAEAVLPLGTEIRLNALSGIGGVWTNDDDKRRSESEIVRVLMPCRALEAFGHEDRVWEVVLKEYAS